MADPRQTGARAHLGVGWAFPVRPRDGRLTYAAYEDDIEQAIDIILESNFLTGVFRLDILSGGFFWDLFTNCDGSTFS